MSVAAPLSMDIVLEAIDALYANPDPAIKEQASKWLCEFQKSVYAWEISDQLLYLKRDLNSSYFGAQTIRIKIQCYFTELPINAQEALKNSLLEHVNKLSHDTSLPIANQLCLALADMYCHMSNWKDGIKDIITRLTISVVSSSYLIDVMKFIPEEMTSATLRLGLNRRHTLMAHLEESKSLLLEFLSHEVKTNQMQSMTKIYNCLASWWDNAGVMTENDVIIDPLLNTAFAILRNPINTPEATFDAASQWVLAILYQSRHLSNKENSLLAMLQANIYGLMDVVESCANAVLSSTDQQDQVELYKDRCISLANIFCLLARVLRSSIVSKPKVSGSGGFGDLHTLECVVRFLELPPPLGNRELASITFHALQSLAGDAVQQSFLVSAYQHNDTNSVTSASIKGDDGHIDHLITALRPYYTRVVTALVRYCPSSVTDLDSTDELRDFREDVHEIMQNIQNILGAEKIFLELFNHVQRLQMINVSGNGQISPSEILLESEACLFMLTTVAKRLSPHDPDEHISNLISNFMLPGLNGPCPPSIQEVGCMLYMELAHWAAYHTELSGKIVEQLVSIVEKAAGVEANRLQAGQKLAVGMALCALGSLCTVYRGTPNPKSNGPSGSSITNGPDTKASGVIDKYWSAIVRVAFFLPRLAWAPVYDAGDFFAGIGHGLVSAIAVRGGGIENDPTTAREALPIRLAQICSVSLECLNKLIDENVPIEGTESISDPRVWLDYLATLFRNMESLRKRLNNPKSTFHNPNQANDDTVAIDHTLSAEKCLSQCLAFVKEVVWPVITRVLSHYVTRMRPMEHACRLIRFLVRCFSVHLHELLPDIAEKIVQAYVNGEQHSSFLYLASVLVDEFGKLSECKAGLVNMFEVLSEPTLKILSGSGISQQPHTVEDFFRLCTRLVQHCTSVFLTSNRVNFTALCDAGVESLNLCSTAPNAGSFYDDNADNSNNNENSASATTSASAAAARFFIDLLVFTIEASEQSPAEIAQRLASNAPLPTPSCVSSLAAQNVLVWLTNKSNVPSGGQRLVTAVLQSCCSGLPEERFSEMADILFFLLEVTKHELFLAWLTAAISSLPTVRADGLVHATDQQIGNFKELIMTSAASSEIMHSLDSFSRLFR